MPVTCQCQMGHMAASSPRVRLCGSCLGAACTVWWACWASILVTGTRTGSGLLGVLLVLPRACSGVVLLSGLLVTRLSGCASSGLVLGCWGRVPWCVGGESMGQGSTRPWVGSLGMTGVCGVGPTRGVCISGLGAFTEHGVDSGLHDRGLWKRPLLVTSVRGEGRRDSSVSRGGELGASMGGQDRGTALSWGPSDGGASSSASTCSGLPSVPRGDGA